MLHGDSVILDVAREVTTILCDADLPGAIIGGVSVVLHGYVRTTVDVDVWTPDAPEPLAEALGAAGFAWNRRRREFRKGIVPVHIVLRDQTGDVLFKRREIEGILTVGLADLINMKLRSGTRSVARSIDLADVVGLIRANRLDDRFTARVARDLRAEFRRILRAVRDEKR